MVGWMGGTVEDSFELHTGFPIPGTIPEGVNASLRTAATGNSGVFGV
jgi:hypothetical protein